ncbi:hypothetical protein [Flavobacterium sp. 3-210]
MISSTVPTKLLIVILSLILKGLKITKKIPLTILLKACCDAKPATREITPAPAKNECPMILNSGIWIKAKANPRM